MLNTPVELSHEEHQIWFSKSTVNFICPYWLSMTFEVWLWKHQSIFHKQSHTRSTLQSSDHLECNPMLWKLDKSIGTVATNFVFQSLSSLIRTFFVLKIVYIFSILFTYFEVFSFRFEKCIYIIELTSKISNLLTHILYLFKILDIGLLSRITIKMFCVICTILERMMDGG